MSGVWITTAVLLLLTIAVGLGRVFRRHAPEDLLLTALLFGTTGVGLMLVLGAGMNLAAAVDVALVLALLAAVLGVAFVGRGWPKGDRGGVEDP